MDGETDRGGGESAKHILECDLGLRPAFVTLGENWNGHRLPRMGRGKFKMCRRTGQSLFISVWPHACNVFMSQNDSSLVPGALVVPTGAEKLHGDREGRVPVPTPPRSSPVRLGPAQQSPPHSPTDPSQARPWAFFLSSSGRICSAHMRSKPETREGGRQGEAEVCPTQLLRGLPEKSSPSHCYSSYYSCRTHHPKA